MSSSSSSLFAAAGVPEPDRVWAFDADWYDIVCGKDAKYIGTFPTAKAFLDAQGESEKDLQPFKSEKDLQPFNRKKHALRIAGFQCVSLSEVWRASKWYLRGLLKGPTAHLLPADFRGWIQAEADKPTTYDDMSHGDGVDHCLWVALNHGYEIMYDGQKVTYDEALDASLVLAGAPAAVGKKRNGIVYGPSLGLERTIEKTGKKNLGFPAHVPASHSTRAQQRVREGPPALHLCW
jgi:hypothetical protein